MSAVVFQRLIGHPDISITLNTYTSVFNKFKENELNKVLEYYQTNSIAIMLTTNNIEEMEVNIDDDMEM